jgi:hypothetical protein
VSSFYRRLQVDVVGNVSGFLAAMNQANLGTSRFSQGMRQSTREGGLFQKQLLAIGTTARYALAGQLVFGIVGAIGRLGEFKAQLGAIDAVAGGQLNDIGRDAILMSNQVGIAATDVEAYMQRFYSSFHPPGGPAAQLNQMESFVRRASMLQRQFGTEAGDPQQLAGGIAGLIHNIPGGDRNIAGNSVRISNLISNLVAQTPNVTGRDIARDIGRVGATMNIARLTPEQAFAVWGQAGMSGGSASVIGRGVAQLLGTSLLHPNTPKQQAAFTAAGLPTDPTMLRSMGGFNVLMRLLNFAQNKGIHVTNPRALLAGDEDMTDAQAAQSAVGNTNLTAIYDLFGRQESVRQFVNLLGQGGVKGMRDWITHQQQAIKVDQQRQRFDAANRQAVLQRFQQARSNIGMSLASGIDWPLENLVGRPAIHFSNALAGHPRATEVGMTGALGLAAAASLRNLGAFRGAGRFGRLGRILGGVNAVETGVISQAISKEELPSAITGQTADGTRANPFWVIVSPLSRAVGGIPEPGGSPLPGPNSGGGWGNLLAKAGGWAGLAKWGGRVGGIAALAGGVAEFDQHVRRRFVRDKYFDPRTWVHAVAKVPGAIMDQEHWSNRFYLARNPLVQSQALVKGAGYEGIGLIATALADKGIATDRVVHVQGEAKGAFTIRLIDKNGREILVHEEKGVPVRLWEAPSSFPSAKGKPGTRRGRG